MSWLLSYQVACLLYQEAFFWALSSSLSFVGSSNAGPILSWQQSQQITQIFHPLLLLQHQFFIQLLSFLKYCIVLYERYLTINVHNISWVIHENRLAYVCPWTITTINHCDPTITCMCVIILKYISTQLNSTAKFWNVAWGTFKNFTPKKSA